MAKLVLIRHGQSAWNKKKIFTGWVDVTLTQKGVEEAMQAGKEVADIDFDVVFTSKLSRAQATAALVLSENHSERCPIFVHEKEKKYEVPEGIEYTPVYVAEELNERHYGSLQGKSKEAVRAEVGEEQFTKWRRSCDNPPPEGECLTSTIARAMPYFDSKILPYLVQGKTVLIAAHGNSLRGIVKEIEKISDEDIPKFEIPTGKPRIYEYEEGFWNLIKE